MRQGSSWASGQDGLAGREEGKVRGWGLHRCDGGTGQWSCLSRGSNDASLPRTPGVRVPDQLVCPSSVWKSLPREPLSTAGVWGPSGCGGLRFTPHIFQAVPGSGAGHHGPGPAAGPLARSPAQRHSCSLCYNSQILPQTVSGSLVPRMHPTPQVFSRESSLFLPSRQGLCTC